MGFARRVRKTLRAAAGSAGLLAVLQPRRIDVCSCGLSKSGTHSVHGLLSGFRAAHHADSDRTLDFVMAYLRDGIPDSDAIAYLRKRDRRLWLETESSSMLGIVIRPLALACPGKKFIMTIRDIYSWFNSWADHHINRPPTDTSKFAMLDRIRLRPESFPHGPFDQPLKELGMESLPAYFALWDRHNRQVLDELDGERLLVIRTRNILDRIPDVADFVGVPVSSLQAKRAWQFATPVKHHVLSRLDPSYVRETAGRFGADLMSRFYPGLTYDPELLSTNDQPAPDIRSTYTLRPSAD